MVQPYVRPQVLVFQEFNQVPAAITAPLRACIVGPEARLHRYGVPAEKATIALGAYDDLHDTPQPYPGKAAGSVIDLSYTKLFVDTGLLRYFEDDIGAGSVLAPVTGRPNQVRSSSVVWKTANGISRDPLLRDRDVQPGDRVHVSGTLGGVPYSLDSYVVGFAADQVAAAIAPAAAASSNRPAQVLATAIDRVAGVKNAVEVGVDASAYNGLGDGSIDETYTLTVVQGSTGGDLTTATVRVTSGSGLDNETAVTPSGTGGFFAVGTRGLMVEFVVNATASASSAAGLNEAPPDDLVAGQSWRIHVTQAYAPPTVVASGVYTGAATTTYIVTVTRGGLVAGSIKPQVTVSTTTGADVAGPVPVLGSGLAVVVGGYGVRLAFAGSGALCAGDVFYVPVAAVAPGALQTLVLGHNLPSQLLGLTDLSLSLSIQKSFQVVANRTGFAPLVNWSATLSEVTVAGGIEAFESSWTDGGVPQPLPLVGGTLFLEYREWIADSVDQLGTITDPADIPVLAGPADPDNPLGFGLEKALANCNGTAVHFLGVADPSSVDSWALALATLQGTADVYNIVPMTANPAVLQLVAAHVVAQSGPEIALWRGCFIPLALPQTVALLNQVVAADGQPLLATLSDDPDTSGLQYTRLTLTSANTGFLTAGVRPGDQVRYLFAGDGFGNATYASFTVDHVVSEMELRLTAGAASAVPVGQKFEIWRTLSKDAYATALALQAGSYGSSRVCPVWPDTVEAAGLTGLPGYYVCAALAGLRSGVVPQQGLSRVALAGFDSVKRSFPFFNNFQLDIIAGGGGWVVTSEPGGNIYTRHALTSNPLDVNHAEEMVRVNVDSISYFFQRALSPLIGVSNVTPGSLRLVGATLRSAIEFLKANGTTDSLGPQLIDGVVVSVLAHQLLKDRIVCIVKLTLPYPLNGIELHLVI